MSRFDCILDITDISNLLTLSVNDEGYSRNVSCNADIERPTREHPNVGYRHNDCNTCNHHKCCQQTHHNDRYKDEVIEQRLRIVEMQMIHNMCITTALNTHVALQNRPSTLLHTGSIQ